MVADDHQRRGIGSVLLETVTTTAREHGLRRLVALVLAATLRCALLLGRAPQMTRFNRG